MKKIQAGSLAGAAYLLQENAGVLSVSHLGQKSIIANKVKSHIDFRLSAIVHNVKARPNDPLWYQDYPG